MNNEFKIMRIRGIDIKIGWSLLFIGTFVSLSLATGYFPALLPGWGVLVYLMATLLSFIGLCASVLLHELAHAFVARKQGLQVKNIVLNLFGGASNLTQTSPNPRFEFWLAMVGPLTNLGLAGILFGILNLPLANPLTSAITFYLMGMNFLLAFFNLIPAYPLDGGRVLKALVWGRTKNKAKANQVVATVGSSFGWATVGVGFFLMASGSFFDGLWLMLFGWFLSNSARLGSTLSIASQSLQGVKVGQVMWRGDRVLSPQTSLMLAAQAFAGVGRERVIPIVDQGYLLGTLSLEQVRKTKAAQRGQVRVEKVMTRRGNLVAMRPEDDLQSSVKTLSAKPASYGAVIGEGGQFAGLLYLSDIPRFLEVQQLSESHEPTVAPSTWPPNSTSQGQGDTSDNKTSQPQPQQSELDKAA